MKKILLSCATLILASSVAAQYWSPQYTGFTEDSRGISGIHIKDRNTVWAFAYDGTGQIADLQEFTKTSNGGALWTPGLIELGDPSLVIQNIVGVDSNTAWVMTSREADGTGGVYKTTDGGESWDFQVAATSAESWNNWTHFFDANNGVFMSDPSSGYFEIFTTSDGGSNWTRVPSSNIPAPLSSEYGYTGGYTYVGDTVFFYTNKGRILKSTDKGLTWSVALPAGFVTDFGSAANNGLMAFSSPTKGLVFRKTFSGTTPTALALYRTTDGTNWSQVTYSGITAASNITAISYIPNTNILIATTANSTTAGSWKSLDNGTTWTQIDTGVQHVGVKCFDDVTCFSGGFSNAAQGTGIFKSSQSLGVDNLSNVKNLVTLYPNPVVNYLKIDAKGYDASKINVNISDASGKLIKSFKSQDSYDLSNFVKGTYVVTITDGQKSETKKIIKK